MILVILHRGEFSLTVPELPHPFAFAFDEAPFGPLRSIGIPFHPKSILFALEVGALADESSLRIEVLCGSVKFVVLVVFSGGDFSVGEVGDPQSDFFAVFVLALLAQIALGVPFPKLAMRFALVHIPLLELLPAAAVVGHFGAVFYSVAKMGFQDDVALFVPDPFPAMGLVVLEG